MNRLFESNVSGSPPAMPSPGAAGYPQNGGAGSSPTVPGAYWFHMMTDSLRNVIVGAGLTPDAADLTLLYQAIRRMGMGHPAGMIVHAIWATPEPGWLRLNGQTISKAGAGGTARANDDVQDLFRILWSTHNDAVCPIQDNTGAASTRGASWSADWAAGKRLSLPDTRGTVLRDTDDGAGRDTSGRDRGAYLADAIKAHAHPLPIEDGGSEDRQSVTWSLNSDERISPNPTDVTGLFGGDETKAKDVAESAFISY